MDKDLINGSLIAVFLYFVLLFEASRIDVGWWFLPMLIGVPTILLVLVTSLKRRTSDWPDEWLIKKPWLAWSVVLLPYGLLMALLWQSIVLNLNFWVDVGLFGWLAFMPAIFRLTKVKWR